MNTNREKLVEEKNLRTYFSNNCAVFKKNNEVFGELSNMSMQFPIYINSTKISCSEALYQSCRFPNYPDLQKRIFLEKSPMKVKMISNTNKNKSRDDWNEIRVKIMRWCINIKLAQNFISFGNVLDSTKQLDIVENSSKDNFWGAIPDKNGEILIGQNALGRLLMELRARYYSKEKYNLLIINKPKVENLLILNENVGIIDCRKKFINDLDFFWNNQQSSLFKNDI